ncbi:MAG: hypothetical protein KAR08_10585 [Candidatus Heimdallarchaeota archaeon]|nr:hypothetical protein [Candidatus Heimdallarchaeota archaeon]
MWEQNQDMRYLLDLFLLEKCKESALIVLPFPILGLPQFIFTPGSRKKERVDPGTN